MSAVNEGKLTRPDKRRGGDLGIRRATLRPGSRQELARSFP